MQEPPLLNFHYTLEDLPRRAEQIAAHLRPFLAKAGISVGLGGPLGAGKTTFVGALCRALGCSDSTASPSFVLEHRYHYPQGEIEHWDLYRLREGSAPPEELQEPPSPGTLRLIEWAERVPEVVGDLDFSLDIVPTSAVASDERAISLRALRRR